MSVPVLHPLRQWTLGAKLAVTFFVVVAGVATLVSASVISHERRALDEELRKRGVNIAENLARLSVDLVLQDDLWGLYKVVRDIAAGSGDSEDVVAYAMVLDPGGRVLAHSEPARYPMGEPLDDDPARRQAAPAAGPSLVSVRLSGGETIHDIAVPVVLDNQRIGLARIGITTRHLEATVARIAREILLMSSVLAGFGVVLGLLISRRMTRPLRELGQAADRIGLGRLDEPVAVSTREKDEIGRLADRFNLMAQRLRDGVREIQETKQYLENLLENANDFIYTLDLEGRITYINHQFLELGLRKEALIGQPHDALLVRQAAGEHEPRARRVFEVEVKGADGEARTLVVTESPLLDNERRVIGTLGIAKDVTERKQLEGRLIKSERLASVGELAGALAHEIRNPLGSLFAAATMLAAESPQAAAYDRQALIRVITEESKRLNRILSDFLQFARPRHPSRRPHALNGLVTEVLESLRLDGLAEGKVFRVALDPALAPVPIDPDQIRQVLWNVVRNALEASGSAGELRVSTGFVDNHVFVEVADSGVGIPPEQQARLFEPFQTTKPRGSGLGLAIAHRIVTAHGGSIELTSRPGEGTRVRILLPMGVAA